MLKPENKIFKNLYNDFGWEIDKAIERNDWLLSNKNNIIGLHAEVHTYMMY